MYQKYTTEGFIVNTKPSKEADILYLFYTRDFGMILASATSVRSSKSKLRGKLVVGALLHITVIKSKTGWKLVEVAESSDALSPKSESYKKFARVLLVFKSLIHGEEKSDSLFEVLNELYDFLLSNSETKYLEAGECLAMVKVLYALGYGGEMDFSPLCGLGFDEEDLNKVIEKRNEIVKEINRSLKITGF
jgi:recombinational DNA repair protein (RecF pathway)